MLSIVIGLLVMALAGYYIFKGYSATGILMVAGLALLSIALMMGRNILPKKGMTSTGWPPLDVIDYVRFLMSDRVAGLGLMIMVIVGFSAYMSHIGANDAVVRLLIKPLSHVKSPYIVLAVAFILGSAMTLAIGSATGLGVLLMATFYPLMVSLGVSKVAATAVIASCSSVILSPITADVVLAAEKAQAPLVDFAIKQTLPVSIITLLVMAVAHFWWQRRMDLKERAAQAAEGEDVTVGIPDEVPLTGKKAPLWYAILPFVPILLVFYFNGKKGFGPELELVTLILIAVILTVVIEFIRNKGRGGIVLKDLESSYHGMGEAMAGVVMLVIAAGVFAQGLSSIGFVEVLLKGASGGGGAGTVVMLVLVAITLIVTVTTGSGNAAFYAFVEVAPKLAAELGIRGAYLIIPMLEASNMARVLSPVSGIVVACSGIAKLNPISVVKRAIVPTAIGFVVMIVCSMLIVPM